MKHGLRFLLMLGLAVAVSATARAETSFHPLLGSNLIEGYDFDTDSGAKGRFRYDAEKNVISGGYKGLKMPGGRRADCAWIHDTVNQKSAYLGAFGWLGSGSSDSFSFHLPAKYKGGNWGTYEVIGFTSEKTGFIGKGNKVAQKPDSPSGTDSVMPPAFYLFGALPGAKTEQHCCGHGKDFFYANAPDKQICYDCICGQKYSVCIEAGLS